MAINRVRRFDASNIPKAYKTPEGFLRADSVVTRTGIFIYRNADGSLRRELRDHKQVFDSVSIDSIKMIPLTLNHPDTESRLVDASNVKQFQVGFTGENVRPDGENVRVPITITDGAAVAEVEAGKRGLSLGYDCDLIEEPGIYQGQRYDARQENILYNHLAIVDFPRAGENARIKIDSSDECDIENSTVSINERTGRMEKIKLDGLEYEAAPEVIKHVSRETARADEADAAVKTEKAAHDATKADRDTLKARVDSLEKEKTGLPDVVSAAVKSRLDLERKASIVLDGADVSAKSDIEIKTEIVKKVFPDAKLDGVSAEYLNARVDGAIESLDKEKRDLALGVSRQQSTLPPHQDGTGASDVESAEKKYADRIKNAYKADGCGKEKKDGSDWGSVSR
jgi:hypothetical protein